MKTIIFKIEIKREWGGFAAASNFIIKIDNKQNVIADDVRGITNIVVSEELQSEKIAVAKVQAEFDSFRDINKPENVIAGIAGYKIAYCFYLDEKEIDDVVDLRFFALIKQYFKNKFIFIIIKGSEDFYYKISHYLYDVNLIDEFLYNSIFMNGLKRLQINNVDRLKDFVPLMYIDQSSLAKLKKKISETVDRNLLRQCLEGKAISKNIPDSPVMRGCLDLLQKGSRIIEREQSKELESYLLNGNFLSFVFFVYSFAECMKNERKRNEKTDINKVIQFYLQMEECAMGCLQLIENAVFHARSNAGVLSIRIHSEKSRYMERTYASQIQRSPYLEVLITDYAGKIQCENIADNFCNKIEKSEVKESFSEMYPTDFIEEEKTDVLHTVKIREAFRKYYADSSHIGRHYGLRIFQNVLKKNNGIFSFYSHRTTVVQEGESWNLSDFDHQKNKVCCPGTSYSVLFPLVTRKIKIIKAGISIEEKFEHEDKTSEYLNNYIGIDGTLTHQSILSDSQDEKEKAIHEITEQLPGQSLDALGKKQVIYFDSHFNQPGLAEYLCKAILLKAYSQCLPDYVFYECSDEFVNSFLQTLRVYWEMGTMEYVLSNNDFAIALFTRDPIKEFIVISQSREKTFLANKLSGLSGNEIYDNEWLYKDLQSMEADREERALALPPYEALHEVMLDNGRHTIFEKYVNQVLDTDIQEKNFGCKISNTHMRLGSTIHIDSFYEAELLFNNRYFISRFVFLLVKEMIGQEKFLSSSKITLYSYALYSESLIFRTINILKGMYPEKHFDYAILEREAEHRGFNHVDRIRYSDFADQKEKPDGYFEERSIICIVPINSTLKTHEKLIDMFCKENPEFQRANILLNFAMVLVGSKRTNEYWEVDEKNRTFTEIRLQIQPIPKYFVSVKVDYQEASECKMCFPKNPLLEKPLIEVNAASTIPNQSFGLYSDNVNTEKINWDWLAQEEQKLSILESSLIYSHVKRGENHFSLYFKTDRLFVENKEEISEWLKTIKSDININFSEYHIIVCPSHFSNAGFLELVNRILFYDSALVIRADIDKEYRCNMEAKYSNLQEFLKMLSERQDKTVVHTYYVDDCIITGRTFQRAKSLLASVLGIYTNKYENLDIVLFEKIFVLLDRNSAKTKMQYLEDGGRKIRYGKSSLSNYYSFRNLRISSLRNHGDSCVICQLAKQDKILYKTSATKWMMKYWKESRKRYKVRMLSEKQKEKELNNKEGEYLESTLSMSGLISSYEKADRSFRRMFCMHVAGIWLCDQNHGNRYEHAVECILQLLITDYNGRKLISQEAAFEYFISYIKVITRPFLSFSKAVREAAFDVLLILQEYLLNTKKRIFTRELIEVKPYMKEAEKLFQKIQRDIISDLRDNQNQGKDFLLVLMKQSMELRSNYFIRPENVRKVSEFVATFQEEYKQEIYARYLLLVKKLVGVNSDTSKSAWLNNVLSDEKVQKDFMGLPQNIFTLLYIENVRAYYDGIVRLCNKAVPGLSVDDIDREISGYQFRDFRLVIQKYGWLKEDFRLNETGYASIDAAIRLLKLSRKKADSESVNMVSLCQSVVTLMKTIAQESPVKLVLEIPMECEVWKDEIKKRYNCLIIDKEKEDPFLLEEKKEYMVISDSESEPDNLSSYTLREREAEILSNYRQRADTERLGFLFDIENRYLIWEIGQKDQYPIIFYMNISQNEYLDMLPLVRNIMVMRYHFQKDIYNKKTRANLYELILSEKERLLYNVNKLESHTSSDIQHKQYMDVKRKDSEKQMYYQSYVLTLLKDLQVSNIYRPGLHRNYYCRELKVGGYTWADTPIRFPKEDNTGETIFYVAGTGDYHYIQICVHTDREIIDKDIPLANDDRLIAFKLANGWSTPFLLVLALIMNAAVEMRAVEVPCPENPKIAVVQVFLTRTENGNLRILNLYEKETKSIEEIRRGLEHPPERDEGISLWSVSRYIKSIVSTLANHLLTQYENERKTGKKTTLDLKEVRKNIEELLSNEFEICISREETQEEKYFSVQVPILAEKYNKYKEYFKIRNGGEK